MKNFILFFLSMIVGCVFCSCATPKKTAEIQAELPPIRRLEPRPPQNTIPELTRLGQHVTHKLSNNHYIKAPVDDTLSEKIFTGFLTLHDPEKLFLTQEDVHQLEIWKKKLDDQISNAELHFPWIVSEITMRRAEEFLIFARELSTKNPDCMSGEPFLKNRKIADFPADTTEQQLLWSAYIKNELIRIRNQRRLAADPALQNVKIFREPPYLAKMPDHERLLMRLKHLTATFRNPDQRTVADQFLNAVALTYDPHCNFTSPNEFSKKIDHFNRNFKGIGADFNNQEGFLILTGICKQGPADRAGLKKNDILLSVTDSGAAIIHPLTGRLTPHIIEFLNGNVDHPKIFEVISADTDSIIRKVIVQYPSNNPSRTSAVTLRPEPPPKIETQSDQKVKKETQDICIITLPAFYTKLKSPDGTQSGSASEVRDAIEKFTKRHGKPKGVILNLRNNPGGLVHEAIKLAGLFIKGPVIQIRNRKGVETLSTLDSTVFYNGPLIILLNRRTASASEMFSAAMQDYGRALIIGDTSSYGKGTIQDNFNLTLESQKKRLPDPAGGLHLTAKKSYRIYGDAIQIRGIQSDIVIPSFTNHAEIGEYTYPNVIPFDKIAPIPFSPIQNSVTPQIPQLAKASEQRIAQHPILSTLKNQKTPLLSLQQKSDFVIINENTQYQHLRDALFTAEEKSAVIKPSDKEVEQAVMNETIAIMRDLIRLTEQKNKT